SRFAKKRYLIGSLTLFTLALLAKESAICLPLLLVVICFGLTEIRRNSWTGHLAAIAPFFAVLLIFVLARWFFIGALIGGYGASQHLNFAPGWLRDRLLEASVRSLLPTLPADWSFFLFKPLQSRLFLLLLLASCSLIAIAVLLRRSWYERAERKSQN